MPPIVALCLLACAGIALLLLVGPAEDIHAPGNTPEGGGSVGAAPGVAAAPPASAATTGAGLRATSEVEASLVRGILEIARSRPDAALAQIDQVLLGNPNFRLAHLVRGDLLLARARPITDFGNPAKEATERATGLSDRAERIDDLRAEALPAPTILRDAGLRFVPFDSH